MTKLLAVRDIAERLNGGEGAGDSLPSHHANDRQLRCESDAWNNRATQMKAPVEDVGAIEIERGDSPLQFGVELLAHRSPRVLHHSAKVVVGRRHRDQATALPVSSSTWTVTDGTVARVGRLHAMDGRVAEPVTCQACGRTFVPSSFHSGARRQRFCGLPCFGKARAEVYRQRREAAQ